MPRINERQWQGRVLQWISELLNEYPDLPFNKVDREFEVLVDGKTRRFNDLTLFDKASKPVCVFELKLPDRSTVMWFSFLCRCSNAITSGRNSFMK